MEITYKLNEEEIISIIREHFSNKVGENVFLHNISFTRDHSTKADELICIINVKNVK
jgi:hypothetical protein